MKTTINERILVLKTQSGLSNLDFCHMAKISHGTLHNIQNGENVSPKTIQTLCESLQIRKEWLLTGEGEQKDSNPKTDKSNQNERMSWQDATYKTQQELIESLREEVKKAWAVASHLSGGKLNFLKLSEKTGSAKLLNILSEFPRAKAA